MDLSVTVTNRPAPSSLNVEIWGPGEFGEKKVLSFVVYGFGTCVCHLNPFKLEMGALLYMQNKYLHSRQRKWEKLRRISIERTLDIWENVKENRELWEGWRILISFSLGLFFIEIILIQTSSVKFKQKGVVTWGVEPVTTLKNGWCIEIENQFGWY